MNLNKAMQETLQEYAERKQSLKTAYLDSVLNPFAAPLCRVPSVVSMNSALLRDKESFQITIGAAGDFVGLFAPENLLKFRNYAIASDYVFAARTTTVAVPSYASLSYYNGAVATPANYASQVVSGVLQHGAYMAHARLVSAGLRIKYIGRMDAHSGLISAGCFAHVSPGSQTPLVSDEINELMFSQRVTPAEGLSLTWLPLDEGSREFRIVDTASAYAQANTLPQLAFAIYGFGLPSGLVLDVEVVRNYEYIPLPAFHELLTPETIDSRVTIEDTPIVNQLLQKESGSLMVGSPGAVLETVSRLFTLARSLI